MDEQCLAIACAVACAVALAAVPARADDVAPDASSPDLGTAVRYHGFLVDTGRSGDDLAADHPALARQVAIVEAVAVPPEVRSFFASVPIRAEAVLPKPPGAFVPNRRGGFVRILADGMAPDRPILLHELLHAYHADVIGEPNATIDAAFRAARDSSAYPTKFRTAHFLENPREYFAVTASIYLFGPIRQPPFDCRVLAAEQPEYLAFLAARFGPHECS